MKKYLFILTMLVIGYISQAQVSFNHTTSNPTGLITDTGADTMTLRLTHGYNYIVVQPVLTKATGTLAGKCLLQYSVNGTNYISSDSLTLANVANAASLTTAWTKSIPARYWRIITNGGTTMSVTTAAKLSTD